VPRAAFIADPAVDPYRVLAGRVGRTPVWVFHGEEDWLIPVKEARRVVAALREAKADVRYTEYPGTGHDAWEETYRDEAVLRWMLAQRRGAP
jgi:predicted peptidase